MIMATITAFKSCYELFDNFTDLLLLYDIYLIGVQPDQLDKADYKIAMITSFLALLAPYWITYSSLLSLKLNQGFYDPENKSSQKWYNGV